MLHRGDANGLAVPRLALDGKRNAAAFGRALGLIAIAFRCQGKHPLLTPGAAQRSPTGHLSRGIDGVFEIVRVIGRGLVSIAEVHAILARAHLALSEPEMARDRFGFLECHGASTPLETRSLADPRFLVSSRLVRDLLLCAKHLLFEANRTGDRARTVARAHDVRTREWRQREAGPGLNVKCWQRDRFAVIDSAGCSGVAAQFKPARPSRLA